MELVANRKIPIMMLVGLTKHRGRYNLGNQLEKQKQKRQQIVEISFPFNLKPIVFKFQIPFRFNDA
jgi:hypothetical protein